jgi:hypothetical protein
LYVYGCEDEEEPEYIGRRLGQFRALGGAALWHVHMVVGAQVLDEVVTAWEAVIVFPRAVGDRAVLEDRVVHG